MKKQRIVLQLFSLGIAICLYLFVNSEGNTSVIDLAALVDVRNIPAGQVVISPRQMEAKVAIKGPTSLVARIAASPPVFRVKLPEDVSTRFLAPLRAEGLGLPRYVQVERIQPSEIEIVLDTLREVDVPVAVPKIGDVGPSLKLDEVRILPSKVTLKGPSTEIQSITVIESYPLDLRDVKGDIERELPIRVPGSLTVSDPATIKVFARVLPIEESKSFEELVVEIRAISGKELSISPARVKVQVSGSVEAIGRLHAEQVVPYVRLKGEVATGLEVPVQVDLPSGITLVRVEPSTVKTSMVKNGVSKERTPTKRK